MLFTFSLITWLEVFANEDFFEFVHPRQWYSYGTSLVTDNNEYTYHLIWCSSRATFYWLHQWEEISK
jgi:hypothetical protein